MNFAGANLTGANLTGAQLSLASLLNTNLTDANLFGANLSETPNLNGVYLGPADLSGAIWSNTTCPDGSNSDTNLRCGH